MEIMGIIIIKDCDDTGKAKVGNDEAEERLQLNHDFTDPDRTQLIKKIIEIIAHETFSEKIMREVNIVNYIYEWRRGASEAKESYVKTIEANVAN